MAFHEPLVRVELSESDKAAISSCIEIIKRISIENKDPFVFDSCDQYYVDCGDLIELLEYLKGDS